MRRSIFLVTSRKSYIPHTSFFHLSLCLKMSKSHWHGNYNVSMNLNKLRSSSVWRFDFPSFFCTFCSTFLIISYLTILKFDLIIINKIIYILNVLCNAHTKDSRSLFFCFTLFFVIAFVQSVAKLYNMVTTLLSQCFPHVKRTVWSNCNLLCWNWSISLSFIPKFMLHTRLRRDFTFCSRPQYIVLYYKIYWCVAIFWYIVDCAAVTNCLGTL